MLEVISGIAFFISISSYSGGLIPRQDIQCMARAIYHEARGEPVTGRVAVAWVIKNRVGHPWYADSICGVVYQPSAFTGLTKSLKMANKEKYKQAVKEAILVYTGFVDDPTNGAIMYHNPEKAPNPRWDFSKLVYVDDIYNHRFYRQKMDV